MFFRARLRFGFSRVVIAALRFVMPSSVICVWRLLWQEAFVLVLLLAYVGPLANRSVGGLQGIVN